MVDAHEIEWAGPRVASGLSRGLTEMTSVNPANRFNARSLWRAERPDSEVRDDACGKCLGLQNRDRWPRHRREANRRHRGRQHATRSAKSGNNWPLPHELTIL